MVFTLMRITEKMVELRLSLISSIKSKQKSNITLLMIRLRSLYKIFYKELSKHTSVFLHWKIEYIAQSNGERYRALLFVLLENYVSMTI